MSEFPLPQFFLILELRKMGSKSMLKKELKNHRDSAEQILVSGFLESLEFITHSYISMMEK